jgi:uncharacterized Fe-S center protein
MAARVYLLRIPNWKDLEAVTRSLAALLRDSDLLAGVCDRHLAAVKLTFGEEGNQAYPPPRRKNSVEHLTLAREHGFTDAAIGAPIVLGDGLLGRESWDVPVAGVHLQRAHLSPTLRDIDFLVGIAHVTGHLLTGYGGAIKNVGMGLASRAGKLAMHSIVSPTVRGDRCTLCGRCATACAADAITLGAAAAEIDARLCTGCAECLAVCPTGAIGIDWSNDSRIVQERMAEYALAVTEAVSGRRAFVNLLYHVSKHCDCLGETPDRIADDQGILAANDPVALDQASLDVIREASGRDPFRDTWPEADPEAQMCHGERIGLGERAYRLVEIT